MYMYICIYKAVAFLPKQFPAGKRRENNLNFFTDFCLKVKAKIWP